MLSDEKKLRGNRGEGKSWTSKIPEIHDLAALYTAPRSTPLASNWEPAAVEEFERDTPKHQRFQQELLAEEHPPSLPHTFDRPSLPIPVKEASIDTCENSATAEVHSKESLASSSHSGPLLPEAKMFPRVSLALSGPSALPINSRMSNSLATVEASSNTKLGDYFRPMEHSYTQFTDIQCQHIARLLLESGKVSWSLVPRVYIILRIIGQQQLLDAFIDQGINDLWLPLTAPSLPHELSLAYHQEFMATQPLVLTRTLDLENGTKGHAHFTRDNPFPFERKGKLGEGGFGSVDRILSPRNGLEFARKRFRRQRNLTKTELQSFMNELNILKRLHHFHCVELVSISPNIKRLVTT